uniref:Uncharacterized protein n=1 Tax=Rangifer tarandus platyrhynchus TaxID=3082113 RepID=A0ACB0F3T0_RANTA|nr:unnamed protein product [Rangifer tarandus platyrhynchus]
MAPPGERRAAPGRGGFGAARKSGRIRSLDGAPCLQPPSPAPRRLRGRPPGAGTGKGRRAGKPPPFITAVSAPSSLWSPLHHCGVPPRHFGVPPPRFITAVSSPSMFVTSVSPPFISSAPLHVHHCGVPPFITSVPPPCS